MTAETITIEQITRLAVELTIAAHKMDRLRKLASNGDITPEDASDRVEAILAVVNKCAE